MDVKNEEKLCKIRNEVDFLMKIGEHTFLDEILFGKVYRMYPVKTSSGIVSSIFGWEKNSISPIQVHV